MVRLPYFCEKVSKTANPKWLQARIQVNFAFEKVSRSIDECATLYQIANMQPSEISKTLGKCKAFVFKWYKRDLSDPTNFYDSPRKGGPVTALTPENMTKLADCEGKLGQSVTVLRDKLGISTGSVSNGFKKLGLFAYRRGVQSRLKKKHIRVRFKVSKVMRHKAIAFWERFLISDEKIWTVDGYFNPQNDRVRAKCKEDVESVERDKFPGKRMVWLGMSARALTPLVHFKGNVNGSVYREKVLDKVIVGDVLQRKKTKGQPIHKRKMFAKNGDMIFEQDFAQPHSTNENQEFMEEHFPAHTPTLWRYEDNDPLFFGPKWDDFWPIERLWAIQSQRVYRNPRPTHISGVMRRLREEVRNADPKTLTRLVHELPAKMNEIYRVKGKKIPSNFDPRKSPYACKCSVCQS